MTHPNIPAGWVLTDEQILRFMHELHSNVPEDKRPMSMSDFSDEQLARIRRAFATLGESPAVAAPPEPHEDWFHEDTLTLVGWKYHSKNDGEGTYRLITPNDTYNPDSVTPGSMFPVYTRGAPAEQPTDTQDSGEKPDSDSEHSGISVSPHAAAQQTAPRLSDEEIEQSEIEFLRSLLSWCYGKLHYRSFDNMDDALMLDRIKLELTGGGE